MCQLSSHGYGAETGYERDVHTVIVELDQSTYDEQVEARLLDKLTKLASLAKEQEKETR